MIGSEPYIFWLQENNFSVIRKNRKKKDELEMVLSIPLQSETFDQEIAKLNLGFGAHARIIVADRYIYTAGLLLTNNNPKDRAHIQSLAQEKIPEDLSQIPWDMKIIPQKITSLKDMFVQVVALTADGLARIEKFYTLKHVTIDSIEPVSVAVARTMQDSPDTNILIYPSDNLHYLILTRKGAILATELFTQPPNTEDVETLITYAKDRYKLTAKPITIHSKDVAVSGAFLKSDVGGKDADSLNIRIDTLPKLKEKQLEHEKAAQNLPQAEINNPTETRDRIILIVAALLALCIIGISIHYANSVMPNKKPVQQLPTNKPIPTQTSTPEPTLRADFYGIGILNGSGVRGAATALQEILESYGYRVVETANAPSYDYDQTIVNYKPSVSPIYLTNLDTVLKTEYDESTYEATLEDETSYDIQIIIGTQ